MSVPASGSWAEACNQYIKEKSFSAPPMEPIRHVHQRDKALEQRAFNPVLGVMIDPTSEGTRREAELATKARSIERGKEKALSSTQHGYDIVTCTPRYGLSEEVVKKMGGNQNPAGKRSSKREPYVSYNILNNVVVEKYKHIQEPPERHKGMSENSHQRDFNVLTHIYHKDNEQRKAQETEKVLRAARAQVATRLNPLVGQFYNLDVEESEREKHTKAEEKIRKEVLVDRTFPAKGNIAKSEGRSYDIIQNKVLHGEGVEKFERLERVPVAVKAALRQKWEWRRDVDEALDTLAREKVLHRYQTQARRRGEVSHGYNIISSAPLPKEHTGVLAEPTLAQKLKKTEAKEVPRSNIIFAQRTRTTHEKMFLSEPSEYLAKAHAFNGRQEIITKTAEPQVNAAQKRGPIKVDPLK